MDNTDLPIIDNKDIEQYDRIDSFILGKMTHAQEIKFLEDCKNDKELRAKAKAVALLVKTIRNKKEQQPPPKQ